MKTVKIDLRRLRRIASAQRRIQEAFGFPAYYGRNLDALHDMLCAIDEPTHVVLVTGAHRAGELAAYLPRLERVLGDSAQENGLVTYEMLERERA